MRKAVEDSGNIAQSGIHAGVGDRNGRLEEGGGEHDITTSCTRMEPPPSPKYVSFLLPITLYLMLCHSRPLLHYIWGVAALLFSVDRCWGYHSRHQNGRMRCFSALQNKHECGLRWRRMMPWTVQPTTVLKRMSAYSRTTVETASTVIVSHSSAREKNI